MEPQLEGCGKLSPPIASLAWLLLQWSRNLRVAERDVALQRAEPADSASMEPQLEGCGKRTGTSCLVHLVPLQWSRNLRVAERLRKS